MLKLLWLLWQLRLFILHQNFECPGQNKMIYGTELCVDNNFDTYSPGYFNHGICLWFTVWSKVTKAINFCCHFSIFLRYIAFGVTHFISSAIELTHSIYVTDPVLPENCVEPFHVVHRKPPHICVAVVSQL